MIRAKNDKSVSKFVKVMPRILWPLFAGYGVLIAGRQKFSACISLVSAFHM